MEMENSLANGFEIVSVAHNGEVMTKRELLSYFFSLFEIRDAISDLSAKMAERSHRILALEKEAKPRKIYMQEMSKPTGLEALSLKKRKEYQKWLDEAPERERKYKEAKRKESKRVKDVKATLEELYEMQDSDRGVWDELQAQQDKLISQNVVSGEYIESETLIPIVRFLVKNRANTLTEAINLYHQEEHWRTLENLAAQQLQEQKKQELQQKFYMRRMEEMQQLQAQEMSMALDGIQRSMDDVRFLTELNFWLNI